MLPDKINFSKREKQLNFKERIAKARESLKSKGLIYNAILGYATPSEINECVKNRIITFRNGYYCIPLEEVVVGEERRLVVAEKYYNYMRQTGRMKNAKG